MYSVFCNLTTMISRNIYKCSKIITAFCQAAIIITISGIPTEAAEDPRIAHACSTPYKLTSGCDRYNATILCGKNERIHIRDAVYGFRPKQLSGCDFTDSTCECCAMYDEDYTMDYGVSEKYSVYKTCSWKQKCTQQTPTGRMGKQTSIYSILKYECVKERPVLNFCKEANATGKHINIIFDGQTNHMNPAECVCELVPLSSGVRYTINAPDLRLMSGDEGCNSEANLIGVTNTNVTCSSKFTNGTSSRLLLGEKYLKLSYQLKPEFIWIKVDVNSNRWEGKIFIVASDSKYSDVIALCLVFLPCATQPDDALQATGSPVSSRSSSKVPVAAVVIPVVLVIAGLGVILVFFLRKRHMKREPSFKDSSRTNIKAEKEPVQSVKYFDHLFTVQGAVKTDENYIVLESENAYDSIKPEDVRNSVKIDKRQNEDLRTISTKELQAEIRQGTYPDPFFRNYKPYMDATNFTTSNFKKEQSPDRHDYLALEDQSQSKGSELDVNNSETNYPQRESDLRTHGDFALEHQDKQVDMDLSDSETNNPLKEPDAGTHDYLVLEPQSLYLSSDTAGLSNTDLSEKSLSDAAEIPQRNNSLKESDNYNHVLETPKLEGWSNII